MLFAEWWTSSTTTTPSTILGTDANNPGQRQRHRQQRLVAVAVDGKWIVDKEFAATKTHNNANANANAEQGDKETIPSVITATEAIVFVVSKKALR